MKVNRKILLTFMSIPCNILVMCYERNRMWVLTMCPICHLNFSHRKLKRHRKINYNNAYTQIFISTYNKYKNFWDNLQSYFHTVFEIWQYFYVYNTSQFPLTTFRFLLVTYCRCIPYTILDTERLGYFNIQIQFSKIFIFTSESYTNFNFLVCACFFMSFLLHIRKKYTFF